MNYLIDIFITILLFLALLIVFIKNQSKILKTIDESIFNIWVTNNISIKQELIFSTCILLFFYSLAFLALFPGTFGNDGPVEMLQLYGASTLSAHHPLAHIYLLGGCFEFGKSVLGSYSSGITLYSIIQGLVLIAVYVYAIVWLRKNKISAYVRLFALLFYALNPIFQVLAFNTTKDILYGAFFLLCFIKLIDLFKAPDHDTIFPIGDYAIFSISSVLMCLFRKEGYFVLAFALIIGVILFWRTNKRALFTIGISILVGWFCMNPLLSLLSIPQGSSVEMFSIPSQQIARVYIESEKGTISLDQNSIESIESLVPHDNLLNYVPFTADPIKYSINKSTFDSNFGKYVQLYFDLGLRYPKIYLAAFCNMTAPYWDFFESSPYRGLTHIFTYEKQIDETFNEDIQRNSLFPQYEKALISFIDHPENYPMLNILFSMALPLWVALFALVLCVQRKTKIRSLPLFLVLGQWGICILGPAILLRYSFPMMLCIPIMVAFILSGAHITKKPSCLDDA